MKVHEKSQAVAEVMLTTAAHEKSQAVAEVMLTTAARYVQAVHVAAVQALILFTFFVADY